jgi:hypothetical protein
MILMVTWNYRALGQAVRNAQAIGLDKNKPGKDCLDTELRRRAWWDLVIEDTSVIYSFSRQPLLTFHRPSVIRLYAWDVHL